MNIDVTAITSAKSRGQGQGHMTNRNLLLGRSKPSERLSRQEIAALEEVAAPPAPPPPRPQTQPKKGGGQQWTQSHILA